MSLKGKINSFFLKNYKKVYFKSAYCLKNNKMTFIGWRYHFIIFAFFCCFVLLIGRAFFVQISNGEFYKNEAQKRFVKAETILEPRGTIYDRNGEILAISTMHPMLFVDPVLMRNEGEININKPSFEALAIYLNKDKIQLKKELDNRADKNVRFYYLERNLAPHLTKPIMALSIKGLFLKPNFKRFYPTGENTGRLIGFNNIDDHGIEGIEKSFDKLLTGENGKITYNKDRHGNVIEYINKKETKKSENIILSIDNKIQEFVYKTLKNATYANDAESATAILIDVETGEILSMATANAYNPNNRKTISSDNTRNKAITDLFEPGSTVKPFVVMTALQQGIADENTVIDTRYLKINNHVIRDVSRRDELTLEGILEKSSNIGVSKLSLQMPIEKLLKTYSEFGFGKPTKLGLQGEEVGFIPKRKKWSDLDRATISYGYGLMVSPVQLAQVYNNLANYGNIKPISITKVDYTPVVNKVNNISQKNIKQVIKWMESVASKGGGKAAKVPNYTTAVKTGTVKKLDPKTGKYIDKYLAYTAGFAPATNPKYTLVILIDEPKNGKYYGGAVSAPVFKEIMSYVLKEKNVFPDEDLFVENGKNNKKIKVVKNAKNTHLKNKDLLIIN